MGINIKRKKKKRKKESQLNTRFTIQSLELSSLDEDGCDGKWHR